MKIVIDIPESKYLSLMKCFENDVPLGKTDTAIVNGTPWQWHPYPQEKPLKSGDYLVTLKYTANYTKMADYDPEFDEWRGNDYMYIPNNCVSAWAELPEPYEKGEEV